MHVAVIGAGLLGLFTARALHQAGARVTVFERREGPGLETSFANGAVLHPSAVDPWNAPGVGRQLLRSLADPDAAVRLRLAALPSLGLWGLRFLRESAPERHRQHTRHNVALALRSVALMQDMREEGIVYDAADTGTLAVHRDAQALRDAQAWSGWLSSLGVPHQVLGRDALVALEPSLAPVAGALAGAIHHTADASGDARRCCEGLAEALARQGVALRWNTNVRSIVRRAPGGLELQSDVVAEAFDQVVVAAAAWSESLTRPLGLRLPVRPAKGYSITVMPGDAAAAPAAPALPRRPLIDNSLHIAITPLPGRLRVAGTAEFCGFDARLDDRRVTALQRQLGRVFPQLAVLPAGWSCRGWTGLRPLSVDGKPLIGPTTVPGLWLNTGHGPLGWTTGAASAELLVAQMTGRPGPLEPVPFLPARFKL